MFNLKVDPVEMQAPTQAPAHKSKKSNAPAGKPKNGQALTVGKISNTGADCADDLVHQIENMGKSDVLERIGTFVEQIDEFYFVLGGLLSRVKREKWFAPYETFGKFIEAKHAMSSRKGDYLVEIYEKITELALPIADFKRVGWSKMRALVRVLTKDNAQHWATLAKENNKGELEKLVQAAIADPGYQTTSLSAASHRKMFKFHDDQLEIVNAAIERAKKQSGTESDSVALEYICLDFQGGQTLPQRLAHCTPAKLAEHLAQVFEKFDGDTIQAIVNKALERHEVDLVAVGNDLSDLN